MYDYSIHNLTSRFGKVIHIREKVIYIHTVAYRSQHKIYACDYRSRFYPLEKNPRGKRFMWHHALVSTVKWWFCFFLFSSLLFIDYWLVVVPPWWWDSRLMLWNLWLLSTFSIMMYLMSFLVVYRKSAVGHWGWIILDIWCYMWLSDCFIYGLYNVIHIHSVSPSFLSLWFYTNHRHHTSSIYFINAAYASNSQKCFFLFFLFFFFFFFFLFFLSFHPLYSHFYIKQKKGTLFHFLMPYTLKGAGPAAS